MAVAGLSAIWVVTTGTPDTKAFPEAPPAPGAPLESPSAGAGGVPGAVTTGPGSSRGGSSSGVAFPVEERMVGGSVLARGFRISVGTVASRSDGGRPRLEVHTELVNDLWGPRSVAQNDPPSLEVHQGGRTFAQTHLDASSTFPQGRPVTAVYTVAVDQDYRWDGAVLVFPVSNQAQPASLPLSAQGAAVVLAPLPVTYHKTAVESGRIHLEFGPYKPLFRLDAAMYAEGSHSDAGNGYCDFDRQDPRGLGKGKGSLKLYFDLYSNPGGGGINVDETNYTIKLPDGRTIHPDSAASLAIYPENATLKRLAIATQLTLPAKGTYTLTFADPNGSAPDSLTFTIG